MKTHKKLAPLLLLVVMVASCTSKTVPTPQSTTATCPTATTLPTATKTLPPTPKLHTSTPKITSTPLPIHTPVPPTKTKKTVLSPTASASPTATSLSSLVTTPLILDFEAVTHNEDWIPYITDFDGVEMALVPAGCFEMGSTNEQVNDAIRQCEKSSGAGNCERSLYQDEQPVNTQCFDEPFWIDVYEVTNMQYGSSGEWAGDELPREQVNFTDAVTHCKSRGARLPTEAEWEYAARGPDGLIFPWGDAFERAFVNSCDSSCEFNVIGTRVDDGYANTAPVGSYASGVSWVGVMNMSGNVWEWTKSIYMDYPYNTADGRETDGNTDKSNRRVLRGGSWFHTGSDLLRSAARYAVSPDYSDYVLGFRCLIPFTNTSIPPATTMPPTHTPLPPLSGGGGGLIAFVSDRDGNFEIYVMNADGSDPRRLTDHPFSDTSPAWSPDGTQIAFVSSRARNRDIYIMNFDGSNLRQLTDQPADELNPVWSPDGTRIGFVLLGTNNAEIYQINVDGSGLQQLTQNNYDDWEFEWSPDGAQLAISSQKTGSANIFLLNADGSGELQEQN